MTRFILPLLALALLSPCASGSVWGERRDGKQPVQNPAKFNSHTLARRKAFNAAGDDGKNIEAFKKKTAESLASNLVNGLDTHAAPAQRTSSVRGLPKSDWLVSGQFIRVNAGSLLWRTVVGFEATGARNAQPGVLTSPGPVSSVLSVAAQAKRGVADDERALRG